ncbi:hypothetical protein FBU31_003422 [Coemansia sp. 'formosensis']|nr:hypothetical protein FBU31_003422 [Coemansia sp. 'formosensis']
MLELNDERHIENDSIRVLIRPPDAKLRLLAKKITDQAAKDMDDLLSKSKSSAGKENSSIASRTRAKLSGERIGDVDDSQLEACIKGIKKRTKTKGDFVDSEKVMHASINSFIVYVAHSVKARLSSVSISKTFKERCRLILLGEITDSKLENSDDSSRIDIGLVDSNYDADIKPCIKARYYQLQATFQVKKRMADVDKVFAQLYEHTRLMYAEQYDLRFAWGFTVCAGDVRVCHFGPSKAMASKLMDITTRQGRHDFIELLVHMSLCDNSQLGRDPTIRCLPDLSCWQIDCPDDEISGNGSRTTTTPYYFTNVRCVADRLFGRHTRCFPATATRPTKHIQKGESIEATVIIKDAFASAKPQAREDDHDEVKHLKKIRDTFADNNPDDILYPKIVVGGRVRFKKGGQIIEDTTSTMYEGVDDSLFDMVTGGSLFRAHRRIVLEPIGEPLCTVQTAKEFIAVICDVMLCHYEIVDKCKILHQDISDNNILVVRKNGAVRGLLIDFDCAIDISEDREDASDEMNGTIPFMSLNNLTMSSVKRTSLDDWESMLYLLCWYATIGFGTIDERHLAQKRLDKLPIARWRYGTMDIITRAKLNDLRNLGNFKEEIAFNFDRIDKHSVELARLAVKLYKALFKNGNFGERYHGTDTTDYSSDSTDDSFLAEFTNKQPRPPSTGKDILDISSPFEMRAKEWKAISKDLFGIINKTKRKLVNWEDTTN